MPRAPICPFFPDLLCVPWHIRKEEAVAEAKQCIDRLLHS